MIVKKYGRLKKNYQITLQLRVTVKKFICEIKVQVDQKRLVVDSKRDVLKIFEDEVIKMND